MADLRRNRWTSLSEPDRDGSGRAGDAPGRQMGRFRCCTRRSCRCSGACRCRCEAAAEAKDEFDVILTSVLARRRSRSSRRVRAITGLGLKEAKELVEERAEGNQRKPLRKTRQPKIQREDRRMPAVRSTSNRSDGNAMMMGAYVSLSAFDRQRARRSSVRDDFPGESGKSSLRVNDLCESKGPRSTAGVTRFGS